MTTFIVHLMPKESPRVICLAREAAICASTVDSVHWCWVWFFVDTSLVSAWIQMCSSHSLVSRCLKFRAFSLNKVPRMKNAGLQQQHFRFPVLYNEPLNPRPPQFVFVVSVCVWACRVCFVPQAACAAVSAIGGVWADGWPAHTK